MYFAEKSMGLCFGFKQKRSLISFPVLTYKNQAFGNVSWGTRFFGSQFLFVPYFTYEHENKKMQRVDPWRKTGPCKTPVIHIKPQILIFPKKKKKNCQETASKMLQMIHFSTHTRVLKWSEQSKSHNDLNTNYKICPCNINGFIKLKVASCWKSDYHVFFKLLSRSRSHTTTVKLSKHSIYGEICDCAYNCPNCEVVLCT